MPTFQQLVLPAVIRSRRHLIPQGTAFPPVGASSPHPLPIVSDGTTYNMAQEVAWLDASHFAVGRWDGSLSIFNFNDSPTTGPVISKAVNTPALEGVQMITRLGPGVFASSNDEASICVWSSRSRDWTDLQALNTLTYDPSWGAANSGDSICLGQELFFIAGHANGFASIWTATLDGARFTLLKAIDLRNPNPTNPWGLHNIRGITAILSDNDEGYFVAGSEDGYVSVFRVPDGTILSQMVYNPAAQRGINSVAALGKNLLVANCSVGANDKNLWLYDIDLKNWTLRLQDSFNLRVDAAAPQIFNFCSRWGWFENAPCFFSSTEEGLLWMGTVNSAQGLEIIGYEFVYGHLGSALAFDFDGKLIVVNHNLYEFKIPSSRPFPPSAYPRLCRAPRSTLAE